MWLWLVLLVSRHSLMLLLLVAPAASAVNRQCSSGLQAVMNVANAIKAGNYSCGIGIGVESMSTNAMGAWHGDGCP